MRKNAYIIFIAVALVVAVIAGFLVIMRAPVPETRGTAPSVVNDTTGAEASRIGPPAGTQDAREVDPSGAAARASRGSGIEGVTSSGTTGAAPAGR